MHIRGVKRNLHTTQQVHAWEMKFTKMQWLFQSTIYQASDIRHNVVDNNDTQIHVKVKFDPLGPESPPNQAFTILSLGLLDHSQVMFSTYYNTVECSLAGYTCTFAHLCRT